ncbi:MAG: outer membrane lipoprotein chaperone LolA [Curvibacter sp.]|nr:outer membrane lipoprotein chaperone LolA [Curvibacter sp.]
MKHIVAISVLLLGSWQARAGGLDALENFVKGTHTGKAEFTQVVSSPPREGQPSRSKSSTGTFEFERPAHFRFVYRKPFEQTLVADGQTVWLYDVDLNQVTARKQVQVLGATPAALLASAPDLKALQADFKLESLPDQDEQEWVQATPKSRDGQIQLVKIGFKAGQLATLDILDSFGQRSVLNFSAFQANPSLRPDTFQFRPPAGADVVRQ